jgi:hypothetical protein
VPIVSVRPTTRTDTNATRVRVTRHDADAATLETHLRALPPRDVLATVDATAPVVRVPDPTSRIAASVGLVHTHI